MDVGLLLQWIGTRAASNPVDKVAGLCSLLMISDPNFQLPVYEEHHKPTEAWQRLMASIVAADGSYGYLGMSRYDEFILLARHLLTCWPVASTTLWHPPWNFMLTFSKDVAYCGSKDRVASIPGTIQEYLDALQRRLNLRGQKRNCQGVHNGSNCVKLITEEAGVWTNCYLEPLRNSIPGNPTYSLLIPISNGRMITVQAGLKPNLHFNPWPVPEGEYTLFLFTSEFKLDSFRRWMLPDSGLICLPPCDGDPGNQNQKCCVKIAPLEIMCPLSWQDSPIVIDWRREAEGHLNGEMNIMYIR